MKRQNKFGIHLLQGKYPEGQLPAGNLAPEGDPGGRPVPPVTLSLWRPGRLAALARLSLFVSLLLAVVILAAPAASQARVAVGVSVTFAPPAIPVYVQPLCPGPGFIWVPGYWAWDPEIGYYWVPGVWVLAPFVGALWTPGYWAWSDGVYIWYEGYWGPVIGFYGGINYGFGYGGFGYDGGYWRGREFYYNRTVNNINVTNITNVYSKSVRNVRPAGVSYNGGSGGTTARPTSKEQAAAGQRRSSLTGPQKEQLRVARDDPKQRATVNRGRPAVAATAKPGEFTGRGVTKASRAGAPYKEPPAGGKAAPERKATGAPQKEPRPAPRRPETKQQLPPQEKAKGKSGMRPDAPERVLPEAQRKEPRPAPRRPETKQQLPPAEKGKGGKEELQ